MAATLAQFQPFFVNWLDEMTQMINEAETWFGLMQAENPTADYGPVQVQLTSIESSLSTELIAMQALVH